VRKGNKKGDKGHKTTRSNHKILSLKSRGEKVNHKGPRFPKGAEHLMGGGGDWGRWTVLGRGVLVGFQTPLGPEEVVSYPLHLKREMGFH